MPCLFVFFNLIFSLSSRRSGRRCPVFVTPFNCHAVFLWCGQWARVTLICTSILHSPLVRLSIHPSTPLSVTHLFHPPTCSSWIQSSARPPSCKHLGTSLASGATFRSGDQQHWGWYQIQGQRTLFPVFLTLDILPFAE